MTKTTTLSLAQQLLLIEAVNEMAFHVCDRIAVIGHTCNR